MQMLKYFILGAALACSACQSTENLAEDMTLPGAKSSAPIKTGALASRGAATISSGRSSDELFNGIEQRGDGKFVAPTKTLLPGVERTLSGGEGVTINLLNVPLAQAAKSVLGDIMHVNYTIADKVVGNITIQTTSPMPKESVIQVFENALKANGAALVRGDGHYKIVASSSAPQSGAQLVSTGRGAGGPGSQVRVVTLQYVSPSEMRRILDPVAPAGSVLSADDARNVLVLTGTTQELGDIDGLISVFDVDWMRGMSIALYPVKSAEPDALAHEVETVMGLDKDGPTKGSVRILPNKRLSAIMVISSKPNMLDVAKRWINQLDRVAESGEEQLFVYKIRNRNPQELATVLTKVLGSRNPQSQSASASPVAPRFEPTTASSSAPAGATPAAPGSQPGTQIASASGASSVVPTSALGTLGSSTPSASSASGLTGDPTSATQTGASINIDIDASSAGQNGRRVPRVVADEQNGALLISATRKEYDRMLQILERLDVIPTQVMLEAVIAEVSLNDKLKFGVKWALNNRDHQVALSDVGSATIGPSLPGFSYFYLTQNVSAVIDLLQSITKVNVVSAPSLMVMDSRKATLQIGDQVPILTQTSANTIATGGPVINSVVMKDTGIILNVTPRVGDNGRVVLDIEQEVSSVKSTTTSGIDSPTIQQRKIHTTVVVTDGEVVALGGLIQESDSVTKSQIPLLGNLPVIGAAFRQKSDAIDRTELLIFIRPQVVRNPEEARAVTDEFRKRINIQRPVSTKGRDIYDRDAQRMLR